MSAPTKGSGFSWVGRSIRRVEDPALLMGRGRFTADLPATYRVRFVRSSVAAGVHGGRPIGGEANRAGAA